MPIMQYEALIKVILSRTVEARDNDTILYSELIAEIVGKDRYFTLLMKDMLLMIYNDQLPLLESIGRCRRKVQEENPSLRGLHYEKRHKKQKNVKQELGYA